MSDLERIALAVTNVTKRVARIQTLTSQMTETPEYALDKYNANLLLSYLEIAEDSLRTVQEMASYLSRPIVETSRLCKNGSGQYESTTGYCFREGSPIEVLVPDKYWPDKSHWERTYLQYDGKDYYLAAYTGLSLEGLGVRIRKGDRP